MPGPWSRSNPPLRPGSYTNFIAAQQQPILPSQGAVVAIPFTADWGPFKTPVKLNSFADYTAVFGTSDTPGLRAVKQAFVGEGLPGYPGAGQVIAYRFGGSAAAKASKVLQNTTPVNALTLTAKYEGGRGNNFNVTVQTNALDATKKDVLIYEGQTLIESYTETTSGATRLADLATQINSRSQWLNATVQQDGVVLSNVTSQALSGGADGGTLAAGDWTAAMTALAPERFSIFAPFDNTDPSILTSIVSWVQGLNSGGKRVQAIVGGGASDTISAAITRSASINDPNFVNLGVGTYADSAVVGSGQTPVVLTTSQLAPRIAGILASRGEIKDLTFARLAGLSTSLPSGVTAQGGAVPGGAPVDSDVVQALTNGVVVVARDSHPTSPLRLERALTTFTTKTDPNRSYTVFSEPRFVKIMGGFEMDIQQFTEQEVITPSLPITKDTREFVVGRARQMLSAREVAGVVAPGWSVVAEPPAGPTDDSITLDYTWTFGRTAHQVRNQVTVT